MFNCDSIIQATGNVNFKKIYSYDKYSVFSKNKNITENTNAKLLNDIVHQNVMAVIHVPTNNNEI